MIWHGNSTFVVLAISMVSKCCWRPETGNDNRAASENPDTEVVIEQEPNNDFTENNLLSSSYEDDVDHKLEITDFKSHSKNNNNISKRKLVKFHDESQVHEIPSKPKRTPKGEQIKRL